MNCKECAKQFTCKKKEEIESYRMIVSDIEECKDKIKFSQAGVFEPERINNLALLRNLLEKIENTPNEVIEEAIDELSNDLKKV